MKKIKVLLSMFAAAAMLLIPGMSSLKAEAAEPVTYAVKYVESAHDWRFQSGSATFDESQPDRELYYLIEGLKPGDYVVVYNDTSATVPELNLGTTPLGNLTIASAASNIVVYCGDITDFFAFADTQCAINANVTTASVYDGLVCNFNKNVQTLNFYIEGEIESIIGCSGTVGHFYGYSTNEDKVWFNYYNFKTGTLQVYGGGFQTPHENFSTTPSQTSTQQPSTSGSSSADEYDEVPKTGDSFMVLWLLGAAVLFMGGSVYFAKKAV